MIFVNTLSWHCPLRVILHSLNPVTCSSLCPVASINIHMVNQIRAGQRRLLCRNSFNLDHFTACADTWDGAAKGQEQAPGENSFWQKYLLTLT